MREITELLEVLNEMLDVLVETEGYRYPFKNKRKLGPGPRGQRNKATDDWECDCKDYKCICLGPPKKDGTPQEKKIVIDKEYKKEYSKEYRQWAKKKRKTKKKGK